MTQGLFCVVLLLSKWGGVSEAVSPVSQDDSPAWNTSCPRECVCNMTSRPWTSAQLRSVDCSGKYLRVLFDPLPVDTEAISLTGNSMSSIPQALLELPNLQDIDLSNNSIDSLGEILSQSNLTDLVRLDLSRNHLTLLSHSPFRVFTQLNLLDLSQNKIKTMETDAFKGLINLVTLSLSGNYLEMVNRSMFRGLTKLSVLNLDYNHIKVLHAQMFTGLSKLSTLNLTNNQINRIEKASFLGLMNLHVLDLSNNSLESIPSKALGAFEDLNILCLDGNLLRTMPPKSLSNCRVQKVSLSRMPRLMWIDKQAFSNLPSLSILELHDNPHLSYIHAYAFQTIPVLQTVYLHQNNLLSLPSELFERTPAVESVTLYNNPLHCSCGIKWIAEMLSPNRSESNSTVVFRHPERLICDTPPSFANKLVSDVGDSIPSTCAPTVIPMFNMSYDCELGGSLSLQCKAIGIPHPKIKWTLPDGETISGKSNHIRVKYDSEGWFQIQHLKASDIGAYTCTAMNPNGSDSSTTMVHLHSRFVKIMYTAVATNFITVTWNGTGKEVTSNNFVILYRPSVTKKYSKILLQTYMRSYTITNLRPNTVYEFCIALKSPQETTKLHCINIQTRSDMFLQRGIRNYSSLAVIVGLCTTSTSVCLLCMCIVLVKRHKRRQAYKEPAGVNCSVSTMSQIPLDNLYQPPSTPLYTSQTCLINQAHA